MAARCVHDEAVGERDERARRARVIAAHDTPASGTHTFTHSVHTPQCEECTDAVCGDCVQRLGLCVSVRRAPPAKQLDDTLHLRLAECQAEGLIMRPDGVDLLV